MQTTYVTAASIGDIETGEEATYYEKNNMPQAPFNYDYSKKEHLNLSNGGIRYIEEDFSLPGKNGFDLIIKRIYNSNEACTMKIQPQKKRLKIKNSCHKKSAQYQTVWFGLWLGI